MTGAGFVMAMTAPLELIYVRDLGLTGWAVAAFIILAAGGVVLVDVLGSRLVPYLEARRALSLGVLLFAGSAGVLGISSTAAPLFLGRALQGVAAGIILGAAPQAALRTGTNPERALGRYNAAFHLGAALGGPFGGLLAGLAPGTAGFRLAFAACCATGVFVAGGIRGILPALPNPIRPSLRWPSLGAGAGVGRAALLATLGDLLRGGVVYTVLPLAGQARGMSTIVIGLAVGALSVGEIGSLHLAGRVIDRLGVTATLLGALAIGASSTAALGLTRGTPAYLAGSLGFGIALAGTTIGPPLLLVAMSKDPTTGLAASRMASGVGMLVGSTAGGAAVIALGPPIAFAAVSCTLVGAFVLAFTLRPQRRAGQPPAEAQVGSPASSATSFDGIPET
jgi:MFS family permease